LISLEPVFFAILKTFLIKYNGGNPRDAILSNIKLRPFLSAPLHKILELHLLISLTLFLPLVS